MIRLLRGSLCAAAVSRRVSAAGCVRGQSRLRALDHNEESDNASWRLRYRGAWPARVRQALAAARYRTGPYLAGRRAAADSTANDNVHRWQRVLRYLWRRLSSGPIGSPRLQRPRSLGSGSVPWPSTPDLALCLELAEALARVGAAIRSRNEACTT